MGTAIGIAILALFMFVIRYYDNKILKQLKPNISSFRLNVRYVVPIFFLAVAIVKFISLF